MDGVRLLTSAATVQGEGRVKRNRSARFPMSGLLCALLFLGLFLACPAARGQNNGMQYQIPAAEYSALVDLYNSTGGSGWSLNPGWLNPNTRGWYGVFVKGEEYDIDGNVVVQGNVQVLDLGGNHLNGNISSSLGNLSQLQELLLQTNQLSGNIPAGLGNLSQLEVLDLYLNELSGSIPASLGNLSQLQGLNLYCNQFSGSIPASLGNLSKLYALDSPCQPTEREYPLQPG